MLGDTLKILSDGFVRLLDVMGTDFDIENAARISYGDGTRSRSDTRTLLRYLYRHEHSTPFEMAEVKFHIRLPMDVMRQYVRHRTQSLNEYSTRYSLAIDEAEIAKEWRAQSKNNKQGSDGELPLPVEVNGQIFYNQGELGEYLSEREKETQALAREVYEERIQLGVSREQARKDLPLSTYTEIFSKMNLRNFLHFLKLRLDKHAQQEIRELAQAMMNLAKPFFPITFEAFEDYTLNSITFSRLDIEKISGIIDPERFDELQSKLSTGNREDQELQDKLSWVKNHAKK